MKRTIRGMRYDTDKATKVAEECSHEGLGDFRYWCEALYRTPRGKWFLHGCGGAMTRWAQAVGVSERTGGEGILPLSDEQALAWLEDGDQPQCEAAIDEYFEVTDA